VDRFGISNRAPRTSSTTCCRPDSPANRSILDNPSIRGYQCSRSTPDNRNIRDNQGSLNIPASLNTMDNRASLDIRGSRIPMASFRLGG
jgi:hypothetical protein